MRISMPQSCFAGTRPSLRRSWRGWVSPQVMSRTSFRKCSSSHTGVEVIIPDQRSRPHGSPRSRSARPWRITENGEVRRSPRISSTPSLVRETHWIVQSRRKACGFFSEPWMGYRLSSGLCSCSSSWKDSPVQRLPRRVLFPLGRSILGFIKRDSRCCTRTMRCEPGHRQAQLRSRVEVDCEP